MKQTCCLLISAIALAGCSSAPKTNSSTVPGADLTKYSTYSWKPLTVTSQATRVDPSSPLHAEFVRLIDAELKRSGLTKREAGRGELTVSYNVLLADTIASSVVDEGVGYGGQTISGRGYSYSSAIGASQRTTVSEEGRVVVNVSDASTNKLLWRGMASAKVQPYSGPVRDAALLYEIVNGIFKGFPR